MGGEGWVENGLGILFKKREPPGFFFFKTGGGIQPGPTQRGVREALKSRRRFLGKITNQMWEQKQSGLKTGLVSTPSKDCPQGYIKPFYSESYQFSSLHVARIEHKIPKCSILANIKRRTLL